MSASDRLDRQERRERTCRSKLAYPNILAALDELMVRLATPTSHIQRTYKCRVCNKWHMTSTGSRKRNPYPVTTGRWLVKDENGTRWVSLSKEDASGIASQHREWYVEPELWTRLKARHGHKNRQKVEQQWNS